MFQDSVRTAQETLAISLIIAVYSVRCNIVTHKIASELQRFNNFFKFIVIFCDALSELHMHYVYKALSQHAFCFQEQ